MNKIKKTLVTHNGTFHADDIFACATLSIYLDKIGQSFEIIRTRDQEIIKSGDFVFDVGGKYNASKNLFDHHQLGGAGKRKNGIEYASFGLVWKKFGPKICSSKEIVDFIDEKLVSPIDAADNGIDLFQLKNTVRPYLVQTILKLFIPSWKNATSEKILLKSFLEAVNFAKIILNKEILLSEDLKEGEKSVLKIYKKSKDKRVIVLDKKYPWIDILSKQKEPIFVIFPRLNDNTWGAEGVFANLPSFEKRKYFPQSWAGMTKDKLEKETGIEGSIFCHRGRFMVVGESKEVVLKLVYLALKNSN